MLFAIEKNALAGKLTSPKAKLSRKNVLKPQKSTGINRPKAYLSSLISRLCYANNTTYKGAKSNVGS